MINQGENKIGFKKELEKLEKILLSNTLEQAEAQLIAVLREYGYIHPISLLWTQNNTGIVATTAEDKLINIRRIVKRYFEKKITSLYEYFAEEFKTSTLVGYNEEFSSPSEISASDLYVCRFGWSLLFPRGLQRFRVDSGMYYDELNEYKKSKYFLFRHHEDDSKKIPAKRACFGKILGFGYGMGTFALQSDYLAKEAIVEMWVRGYNEVEVLYDSSRSMYTFNDWIISKLDTENIEHKHLLDKALDKINGVAKLTNSEVKLDEIFFNRIKDTDELINALFFYLYSNEYTSTDDAREYLRTRTQVDRVKQIDSLAEYALSKAKKNILTTKDESSLDTKKKKYIEDINALPIDDEYKNELITIVEHLSDLGSRTSASEMTYLDTVIKYPWKKFISPEIDITKVKEFFDTTEFAMEKPKERILEYLAALEYSKGKIQSPIICLVGPPGVGKTFFAKMVAKALNRPYVSIAMGGLTDAQMLRGDRRVYISSAPGMVTKAIMRAKSMNPIIVLDEIDKLSTKWSNDVESALLELLDPNQNFEYTDHFLEIPTDLSKVIFIATANYESQIAYALKNRLDIIEIDAYTREEKEKIAKEYLFPDLLEQHSLEKDKIDITQEVWEKLLNYYKYDPGVRGLARTIGAIIRKVIVKVLAEKAEKIEINLENIDRYVDVNLAHTPRSKDEIDIHQKIVGKAIMLSALVVNNTFRVGGNVSFIEAAVFNGKGKVTVTGTLSDVFTDSIKASWTYVKSVSKFINLPDDFANNIDIAVHVPELGRKVDGPSAGTIIAILLISAVTKMPIRIDIGVTGEMDIFGSVLPVGGIKEKVSAAYDLGIREFVIPKKNETDWLDVPENIRKELTVHFVTHISEVIPLFYPDLHVPTPENNSDESITPEIK